MPTRIRAWLRRRQFRDGQMLSRFIARDVRRDVLVVSAARVEDGIIIGSVRTTNLLYVSKGLIRQPDFEPAMELRSDDLWKWTGNDWGGLPDGTSLADEPRRPKKGTDLFSRK